MHETVLEEQTGNTPDKTKQRCLMNYKIKNKIKAKTSTNMAIPHDFIPVSP
jgi:hypothetical protein